MVTKPITFNIWQENTITLILNQGEINSRCIEATFNDVNEKMSLKNRQVTLYAQKPDGTFIFNNCDIDVEQNTASVVITSQMVSAAGILYCEFQIFDSENSLLKVNGLKIIVSPNNDFSEAIESSSEYNALIEAINKAQTNNDELENYLGKASILSANIGTLSDLTTEEKSSLVTAVNEVNTSLNQVSNTVDGINTSLNQVSNTVDGINTDLNELNAAINEVNTKVIPLSQGGTGATTLTSARENLGILAETILYSNDSGTQGTITLSDSVENYDYIEIFYRNDSSNFKSVKIDNPNGRSVALENIGHYADQSYLRASVIVLSGSNVTWQDYLTGFQILTASATVSSSSSNLIFINKIIGYSN